MSRGKLYTIPLEAPFVREFTRLFIEKEKSPEKTAVVFPHRRTFLYFQKELAGHFGKPLLAPGMLAMDDFINGLVESHFRDCRKADELDVLWILYSIIRERAADFPSFDFPAFDKFVSWGRHIYKFLNLVDSELVSDKALVSIQDAAEKGFDVPDSINRILANIRLLRKLFHERLEQEKLTTRGYVYFHALELVSGTDDLEWDHVWFAGLFGLTATEKNLVKRLIDAGKATLVWHGEPRDWKILSELEKFFGIQVEPVKIGNARTGEDVQFFSVPNYHIQALKTAEVIRTDGNADDTVVVITDISALQPVLNFTVSPLLEEGKVPDFNITIGYGIDRTSFFGLLELIIRLQMTARKERNGILVYVPDYLSLLAHPFIRNLFVKRAPNGMRDAHSLLNDIFLDEEGPLYKKVFVSPFEIESLEAVKLAPDVFSSLQQFHEKFLVPFQDCVSLGQIAENASETLRFILTESPEKSYVLSGEIIGSMLQTLKDIAESRSGKIELGPHLSDGNSRLLYGLFLEQFSGQSVKFATSPLQPLEIMGMLETRNLNFKNVMVLNCEEGILPKEREIDPLIPVSIYPWLNLPPVENSEEMYRYYFFRLIGAAEKVRLFYIKREDSFRSRFIEEMIWKKQKAAGTADDDHVENSHFKISAYKKSDELTVEKTDELMELLKNMEYSPSLINLYLNCPLALYYQRILGFREKKEFSADIDAAETGLIIHTILEKTFKPFLGRILGPEAKNEMMKIFSVAIKEAFTVRGEYSGEFLLLGKVVEKKLEIFLESHLTNCAGHKVLSLEDRKRWRREFDTGRNKALLKGTIDRIDLEPGSGNRVVYDYKSGNSDGKYSVRKVLRIRELWTRGEGGSFKIVRENIADFQLPIYVWLVNEGENDFSGLDAVLLFLRDNEDERFFNNEKSGLSREDYHRTYMDSLKIVIDHILDQNEPFRRFDDTRCKNCGFSKMCRSAKSR